MAKLPRLISLVPQRFEDGGFSGVPRFDWELRRALPEVVSVNTKLKTRAWLRWLAWREPDAIVITGNETSLLVPETLRTVVLHHGCAQTHFDRDPAWRNAMERSFCKAQRDMYCVANRWFVSSALWTAQQFSQHHGVALARILPSWVETIARPGASNARPVVLGDFRTANKGSEVVEKLSVAIPQVEFRLLRCTYDKRKDVYGNADAYLCLSLSEGGSFSVSDAEATSLPLITTDVGNYLEYTSSRVIPWQKREDVAAVASEVEQALVAPRGPSFFESWTFDKWRQAWRTLLEEVADVKHREPLLGPSARA
jgi:glycosyltransferase involved in cell wall biosynthesis